MPSVLKIPTSGLWKKSLCVVFQLLWVLFAVPPPGFGVFGLSGGRSLRCGAPAPSKPGVLYSRGAG